MTTLMTPGVYIEEKNAFPNSVVEIATAVPIFIGYTQKAERKASSLIHKPTRITSFAEYVELFGTSFKSKFELVQEASGKPDKAEAERAQETNLEDRKSEDSYVIIDGKKWYVLLKDKHTAYMYNSIRLFFGNEGGPCYILSVGTYGNNTEVDIKPEEIINEAILGLLEKEQEPTLVVAPDLIAKGEEAYSFYKQILAHCSKVQRCFAILDIAKPETQDSVSTEAVISVFREKIGVEALSYGAAYYPWLKTSIVQPDEVDGDNLDLSINQLKEILPEKSAKELLDKYEKELPADINPTQQKQNYHKALKALSPTYAAILDIVRDKLNLLPPSAAMAGIYTMVDNRRGVWKAPANVAINMANMPSVNISSEQQEGFSIDVLGGKSINAIRAFPGIGTLVWGGRTLDGNSQDWRYINVKRTVIMIEQSIKLAASAYIFEPNDATTWATIKSMIGNFLNKLWKDGALAAATPDQAFDVQVGLGSTMTATDILEGKMLINVKVAIVRPAEFIVITIVQQMQKR